MTEQTRTIGDSNRRTASPTQCRCGVWVLDGLDDDICAWPARADLSPLHQAGIYAAHYVEHRQTYLLIGGKLWRRDPKHLTIGRDPTVAHHICDQPIPTSWLADLPPPQVTADLPTIPPF